MNRYAIEVKNLGKVYIRGSEKIHALKNVSFGIPRGEFVAIVGPSGSGKTTLLNLLGCLDTPSEGSIFIGDIEASKLSERELVELRRNNIGFVFQQFFLLPTLNVSENISLPLLFNHRNQTDSIVQKILGTVGLTERADHLPHQLSGGEMQRVAIGRALINEPGIILADEPTGNLDSATAQRVFQLFQKLCDRGISLVIVTHNMELATTARGIISLKDGEIDSISDYLIQVSH